MLILTNYILIMRYLLYYKFIPIVLMGMLCFSCSKNIPVPDESVIENSSMGNNLKGSLLQGKKLPNPYTIPHMEDARQLLLSEDLVDVQILNSITIETTDLYVRFKIKSSDEYELLSTDLALELFPYPLDYDYGDAEGIIVDPESGDKPEWLYTVVSKDFQFPDILYLVIDEVFMPRSYKELNSSNKNVSDILNILEQKSYVNTG